jgi:hypothetical protein
MVSTYARSKGQEETHGMILHVESLQVNLPNLSIFFFGRMDKAIVLPHPTYASLHKQRKKFDINKNLAHFPRPHSHGHLDSILTSGKTCTMVSKKGLPFCIGTKFHTIKNYIVLLCFICIVSYGKN